MSIPNHCYQKQTFVGHPSSTLKSAAKWLELSAKDYRHEKNHDAAHAMMCAARALRKSADGATPAEAFEFPPQVAK